MDAAIKKFEVHPSILTIKEKVNITNMFSFEKIDVEDMELEIKNLNEKKGNTFNGLPPEDLKKIAIFAANHCTIFLMIVLRTVFSQMN